MKKMLSGLLIMTSFCTNLALYEYLNQNADIDVYGTDKQSEGLARGILEKCGLDYRVVDTIEPHDDERLYILTGDLDRLSELELPKYYIVYQTKQIYTISKKSAELLKRASVIWDIGWSNIRKYKGKANHWYYLPNVQYEFLDPVILPLFLPLYSLNTYKGLVAHSNSKDTDISSHLPALFCHCFFQNPGIIIESGIRWGNGSTIPLSKMLDLLDAYLIGLDINDCSKIYAKFKKAHFVKMNDVDFPQYFQHMELSKDKIDFVFIDTSHQYEHTLQEIDAFSSILSETGAIGFHDSNVAIKKPIRINGTACPSGLGNPKGVTDGLKTYFNIDFNEGKYLNTIIEKDGYIWNLVNYPYCYGMAVAKRIGRVDA